MQSKTNLFGLERSELERIACDCGESAYRGRQIFRALYRLRASQFGEMAVLGRAFRDRLAGRFSIVHAPIRETCPSQDGSARYVLGFADGEAAETVYMPEPDRVTLCISSQAGCAVDCRFCFTALMGLRRNLSAGEILGQVYSVLEDRKIERGTRLNLVFMGMGEPLLNYDAVMHAVRILADRDGLGLSPRRITLSTSGIIPGILRLAREEVRPKLAVSLNASTDEQRSALMPINRKYPLEKLMAACRAYPQRPRERLTFEYVLLDGVNDTVADAQRVAGLVRGLHAKVNVIPYNSGDALPYRTSPFERVLAFEQTLRDAGVPAFIRISRGRDIRAACGQLLVEGARKPITAIMRPAALPSLR